MANQRWTADKNIQFINEYQRNECLWDPKHPQYKNRDAREAAYKVIMEVMQMETVKDVVGKIRTLRNTYNNETLKAKKCNATGMATDELYISKIPWLPHMGFLKNIDSYTRENTENMAPNITQEALVSEASNEEFTVPRTPIRNKRKIKDPLLKAIDALEKVSSQHFLNAGNDEFDLFGQTIAQQLRQLPLGTALETEEMILSIIRRQRIRILSSSSTSSSQRHPLSPIPECIGSNRSETFRTHIPEEQRVSQRYSSSESESIASASGAITNDIEDEYSMGYNNDILSQAIASITDRELDFNDY
ncbi:uncharacterized protein ACR2FA_004546 [Aphomia sociella]